MSVGLCAAWAAMDGRKARGMTVKIPWRIFPLRPKSQPFNPRGRRRRKNCPAESTANGFWKQFQIAHYENGQSRPGLTAARWNVGEPSGLPLFSRMNGRAETSLTAPRKHPSPAPRRGVRSPHGRGHNFSGCAAIPRLAGRSGGFTPPCGDVNSPLHPRWRVELRLVQIRFEKGRNLGKLGS